MRRTALPILVVFLAVLAAAVALGQVGGEPGARAAAISTSGAIEIANDRDGLPVFAAAGIGPGDSARGTVEIADTGSGPVALTLSRHDLLDAPGAGGGLLSAALTLTVTDVTDPAAPLAVYAGPLATMPATPAGRLEPGASRRFEFVATLPAAGAGGDDQNALQGASVSVAYEWTATEAGDPGGPGDPGDPGCPGDPGPGAPGTCGPGGQGGGPSGPGAAAAGANPPTPAAVPLPAELDLAVTRAAKRLRGARLLLWAGCDRACAIVVRGRLRATAAGRHRGARVRFGRPTRLRPAGVHRLRVRVPVKLRRWLATAPGKRRLRATLVITATDSLGARVSVKRKLALKPPRRR